LATLFIASMPEDQERASELRTALVRDGAGVVWGPDRPPGEDALEWTRRRIAEAHVVVVLWSRHALASPTIRHQADLARRQHKLLSARLEPGLDLGPSAGSPVDLTDWPRPQHKGYARIRQRLAERVRASASAPATATPVARSQPVVLAMAGLWMLGTIAIAAVILLGTPRDVEESPPPAPEGFAPQVSVTFTDKRWVGEWPPEQWAETVQAELRERLGSAWSEEGQPVDVDIEVGDLVAGRRPVTAAADECREFSVLVRSLDALDSSNNEIEHGAAAVQVARQVAFCLRNQVRTRVD